MGSLWLLKLFLKCIDHFAWPLLALGYPLCASVQAIETDSYTETRNLISYWILFSLIYLFEYAFMRLLLWFHFWPYIKLMVIFWLIIPDFGRSSYVYNYLVHSSVSLKPQAVMSRLKNWKMFFVKKQNFLLHAERYIEENGTEALEKLIANKASSPFLLSKNANMTDNTDAEATNALRPTDMKETQQASSPFLLLKNTNMTDNTEAEATNAPRPTDMKETQQQEHHHMQTNGKRHQTEHKDIKDVEVIEKKETPAGKRDIPIVPNLAPSQNASSAMVGKETPGGEFPWSSTNKEVQKEWTCAICQVITTCESNLNSHLHGKKHKDTCEALKAKNKLVPQKQKTFVELKPKNILLANIEPKSIQISQTKENAQTSRETEKSMLIDAVKLTTTNSQENKRKYVNVLKINAPANKSDQLNAKTKNGESIVSNGLHGKVVIDHKKVQALQKNLGKPVGVNPSKLRCEVCKVNCTSEADMASHLNGKKHLAQIQN